MKTTQKRQGAFTLIELIIVIAIMVVLFSLVATLSGTATNAMGLSTAGDTIYNRLVEAQQEAIAKSTEIEVRIYRYDNEYGEEEVRGIGFFHEEVAGAATVITQAGNPYTLTPPYVLSSGDANGKKLSTLADPSDTSLFSSTGTASPPSPPLYGPAPGAAYTSFRFRPDGSTNLPPRSSSTDQWHLTLVAVTPGSPTSGETDLPANFYTIRIDPYTGRMEKWRP